MPELTPIEQLVVEFIKEGKTSKEIAGLVDRSVRTIEAHRAHALAKLGVNSRKIVAEKLKKVTYR